MFLFSCLACTSYTWNTSYHSTDLLDNKALGLNSSFWIIKISGLRTKLATLCLVRQRWRIKQDKEHFDAAWKSIRGDERRRFFFFFVFHRQECLMWKKWQVQMFFCVLIYLILFILQFYYLMTYFGTRRQTLTSLSWTLHLSTLCSCVPCSLTHSQIPMSHQLIHFLSTGWVSATMRSALWKMAHWLTFPTCESSTLTTMLWPVFLLASLTISTSRYILVWLPLKLLVYVGVTNPALNAQNDHRKIVIATIQLHQINSTRA